MRLWLYAGAIALVACGDDDDETAPPPDAGTDAPPPDAAPPDAAPEDAGPELPAFPKELAPTTSLGERGTFQIARATIHFHTPLSHDACDGEGWVDGVLDEACLEDMRRAICRTRQDVVFATDHDDFHADVAYPDVFLMRAGDEIVLDENGEQIGSALACEDGHRPVLVTGEENEIMPIALRHHPDAASAEELHDLYDRADLATADAMRAAGGVVVIPHAEHWNADDIEAIQATAMELYNFHANIDRDIREEFLGLPADDAIAAALIYALDQDHPEPDLTLTAFLAENEADLATFDTLHARGVRIAGVLGNDVHQNSFPGLQSDGERGDSYRRLLRWMSNYFLVEERSPEGVLEALAVGRLYAAFDALGTPDGFDFRAEDECTGRVEMGGTTTVECAPVLRLTVPTVQGLDPSLPDPVIRAAVLRVDGETREEVATGSAGEVAYTPETPGVFRAVVTITPEHYRPYYNGADEAYVHEFPWVYGNPVHVEAP